MVETECYRIGDVFLNAGTQEVRCAGQHVPLPPLSFALLLTLARNAPNVVPMDQIEKQVWSGVVVDRGTVNKRVVLVRQSLRDAGCKDDFIAVVRGIGYRISAPVEPVTEENQVLGEPKTSATESPVVRRGDPWLIVALVSMAIAVASLLAWVGHRGEDAVHADRTAAPAAELAPVVSLAVIPFVDGSADASAGHLGVGLAREISRLLDAVDGVQVSVGSDVLREATETDSPPALAERLGVDAVLTGVVAVDGGEIVVDASLYDARRGTPAWSERYSQDLERVFAIQDDVAAHVAMSLQVASEDLPRLDSRRATTDDIRAFTQYLKGKSLMDERVDGRGDALRQALTNFRAAVERDPGFVDAYVGVATAQFLLPFYDQRLDQSKYLDDAETTARYALELDPNSAAALGVLAGIKGMRGNSTESMALFERAFGLGSRDPNVLIWSSMIFNSLGYFERMETLLEDGYRFYPLDRLLGCALAANLAHMGLPEAASTVLRGLPSFPRRDRTLAMVSVYLGDFRQARELLRDRDLYLGRLTSEYADLLVSGLEAPERREAVAGQTLSAVKEGALDPLVAFEALLILGSPSAFDVPVKLEGTLFESRLPEWVWNNWAVDLRRDPRFKQWVRTLGYDRYWRQFGWPDRCKPVAVDDFECV